MIRDDIKDKKGRKRGRKTRSREDKTLLIKRRREEGEETTIQG